MSDLSIALEMYENMLDALYKPTATPSDFAQAHVRAHMALKSIVKCLEPTGEQGEMCEVGGGTLHDPTEANQCAACGEDISDLQAMVPQARYCSHACQDEDWLTECEADWKRSNTQEMQDLGGPWYWADRWALRLIAAAKQAEVECDRANDLLKDKVFAEAEVTRLSAELRGLRRTRERNDAEAELVALRANLATAERERDEALATEKERMDDTLRRLAPILNFDFARVREYEQPADALVGRVCDLLEHRDQLAAAKEKAAAFDRLLDFYAENEGCDTIIAGLQVELDAANANLTAVTQELEELKGLRSRYGDPRGTYGDNVTMEIDRLKAKLAKCEQERDAANAKAARTAESSSDWLAECAAAMRRWHNMRRW